MQLKYFLAASAASLSMAVGLAAPAHAQQITSGINGTVVDENGSAIGSAEVTVTDTRTGSSRTIATGADGKFLSTNLVTGGPYTITASAVGYESQTVENVNLTLQGNASLTFTLSSGSGVIVVTGSRVNLTQFDVGPGQSFAGEVLENAPSFNRDIRDVIRFDPRVSLDRDDGGNGQDRISCLGGNDRGNAFTVDGISQGDVYGLNGTGFSSRSSTPLPFDAIRETQVAFAPFDVDYGNFTGCAINVVTRSGGNRVRAGAFFEYSDDSLRGNSVAGEGVSPIEPEKRWGVYLGGPVIKDRLFLFGAYEHSEAGAPQDVGPTGGGYSIEVPGVSVAQFEEISQILSSTYGVETGPLLLSRPFENDRYFVRADLQINDDHRLEATYQRMEEATVRADDQPTGGSFFGTVAGRNTYNNSGTKSNYYSGRLYSQWSDNFSSEIRYSRSEIQDLQDPIGGGEAQDENPIPRFAVGIDNGDGVYGMVAAGPGFSRAANDLKTDIDQLRIAGTLEAGDHKIKVGMEWNHASLFNLFVQNATGTLVFQSVDDLRNGILSNGTSTFANPSNVARGRAVGAYGNFTPTGDINTAAADFHRDIYSIFLQDEWRATDQLDITMGVRVDWYNGARPQLNQNFVDRYGFNNITSFSNISPLILPRLAFSYDMDDFAVFSRAQLRGGAGIFSGGDPLVWFGNAFQNNGIGSGQGDTDDRDCPAGPINVLQGGTFTGVPECIKTAGGNRAAAGLADTQSIDPDLKMPSVFRANLGFSSDLDITNTGFFSGWNLNLDYIYSRYRNPLSIVDLSQIPDIREGLNGFAIDGRPIYAAIDPTDRDAAGCNATLVGASPPQWQNVTPECFNRIGRDNELMLTNVGSYESHIASILLGKRFDGGLFTEGGSVNFNIGYSWTKADDRRNMFNSTAGSNYDRTAAFDRQAPLVSRGFYESRHNLVVRTSFREEFFDDLSTRLGISFVARSGRPYSLTFTGGGVFNDSTSGNDNVLAYIPSGVDDPNISDLSDMDAVRDFASYASGLDCAKDYLGQSIARNTCTNDWYYDVDLSFSQEIPGPGRFFGREDKLRLYATMDNFLNFLDSDWGVHRRRNFSGLQDVANSSGVDAQGRYIIDSFRGADAIADDNRINFSTSVWRLKVGLSYKF